MTSVLSPGWDAAALLDPIPLAEPVTVHHVLDGLAGFYASEDLARAAVRELQAAHGLDPTQLELLTPGDVGWLRFWRRAKRWNRTPVPRGRHPRTAMVSSAAMGALVAALLVALVLAWADLPPLSIEVLLPAALTGALVGTGLAATLARQQPQFRKFDRVVRRRLAAGEWVLVAHDVPWKRQAGVVSLVNQNSLKWYGVSSEQSPR